MDSLKNILVAVDFSPCSADAFRQAARIASWNSARLSAIHVIDIPLYSGPPDPILPIEFPPMDDLISSARERWDRFIPDCTARAATPLSIEIGSPREHILSKVFRDRPDLLVIGAHSALDARRGIGAVAAACAQRAAARVMIVREGQTSKFKSTLVCVDFSPASLLAVEQGVRIAANDGGALHLLHVYDDPWHGLPPPEDIAALMPDFAARYRAAVGDRLRAFCQLAAHELGALKAQFHAQLSHDRGEGIIAFAQRHGCDLTILGTRSRWNLRDFFWGTTAERVVRECPTSVLAIKPPDFQPSEPEYIAEDAKLVAQT